MLKIKRIAFDFDGVIADTNKEKVNWLKNRGINIKNTDKTSFYEILSRTLKKEEIDNLYKNMSKDIFTPQVLEKTKPVKDSIKIIKKLSKIFNIYIITSRTEELIKPVNDWMKKYHINSNIKQIISSSFENKQDICLKNDISFLCDDDFRHVIEKKVDTRILFNSKLLIDDNDIIITESWKKLEKILLKLNV